MGQAIFNLNTRGTNDKCFTIHIKDLILPAAPPMALNSLAAILTPFIDHPPYTWSHYGQAKLGDMKINKIFKSKNKSAAQWRTAGPMKIIIDRMTLPKVVKKGSSPRPIHLQDYIDSPEEEEFNLPD